MGDSYHWGSQWCSSRERRRPSLFEVMPATNLQVLFVQSDTIFTRGFLPTGLPGGTSEAPWSAKAFILSL